MSFYWMIMTFYVGVFVFEVEGRDIQRLTTELLARSGREDVYTNT